MRYLNFLIPMDYITRLYFYIDKIILYPNHCCVHNKILFAHLNKDSFEILIKVRLTLVGL